MTKTFSVKYRFHKLRAAFSFGYQGDLNNAE